ncbi:MAG: DUF3106 domain-containing protein [Propionivibrio sp.]
MAKSRLTGLVLAVFFTTTGWAATPSPSLIVTPPQPKWSELTVQQKTVLAPLSDDWDSLEYHRQKKWLGIVARFPSMTPQEQRRIQIQMQGWGKLTDDEREQARENYISTKQLPLEQKRELKKKWEEYSNLPEEERARLRERAMQFVNKSAGGKSAIAPMAPPPSGDVPPPAVQSAAPQTAQTAESAPEHPDGSPLVELPPPPPDAQP